MFWRQKWTEAAGDIRVILCSCSRFRNVMKWERRDSSTFTALGCMGAKKREAVIERKPTDIQSMNWFDRENLSERKKKGQKKDWNGNQTTREMSFQEKRRLPDGFFFRETRVHSFTFTASILCPSSLHPSLPFFQFFVYPSLLVNFLFFYSFSFSCFRVLIHVYRDSDFLLEIGALSMSSAGKETKKEEQKLFGEWPRI